MGGAGARAAARTAPRVRAALVAAAGAAALLAGAALAWPARMQAPLLRLPLARLAPRARGAARVVLQHLDVHEKVGAHETLVDGVDAYLRHGRVVLGEASSTFGGDDIEASYENMPHELAAARAAHLVSYGADGARDGPSFVDKEFGIRLAPDSQALVEAVLKPSRDKTDMPPASEFALSKRMIEAVADSNNVVMVTWANFHYLDFVLNWVYHLRRAGSEHFIVGAMDDDILRELWVREIPCFQMSSGLTTRDFGWGTPTFHKMGRSKIELIGLFVEQGFDILLSDVDTVWMKDPLPYMARYPKADVLTSSDHLATTVEDDGLEKWPGASSAANIGIMLFRSTEGAKKLAKEWMEVLVRDDKIWDQNAFNDLFRRGNRPSDSPDRTFACYEGQCTCGILNVATFGSGHTFFVQRQYESSRQEPYVLHATFQFSGTEGKRHRMREANLWLDPPEYYDPPGGLLVYQPTFVVPGEGIKMLPREKVAAKKQAADTHFAMVHAQLADLRRAAALAGALGRTLVLPPLLCGYDRWWAPHTGQIPGSGSWTLPFLCPADHVLDLPAMLGTLNGNGGFPKGLREYSMLQHQHMPSQVLASRQLVAAPAGGGSVDSGAAADAVRAAAGKPSAIEPVRVPAGLAPEALAKLLEPLRDVKVLDMGNLTALSMEDPPQAFMDRTKNFGSIWCCVFDHPGHIWYDMLFDQVPHKDRHGRTFDGPWEARSGP